MKKCYALLFLAIILTISCVEVSDCQGKTQDEYLNEAERLTDAGEYKKVATAYEEMFKEYPEAKTFYGFLVPIALGEDYIMQGKLSDAENQMEEALKQYPDKRATILGMFATIYMQAKKNDKAISLYEESAKLDPNNTTIRYAYASLLEAKGMYAEAEKQCRIYLDSYPNDYNGWWIFGNILWHEKKYDDAIDAYNNELKLNPKKYEVLDRITNAYRAKGDYGKVVWYSVQTVQERERHGEKNWFRIFVSNLISFIVMLAIVYIFSNRKENKENRLKQAILVAVCVVGFDVMSAASIPFLPVIVVLLTIPLSFIVYTLLCRYICKVSWKKSLIMMLTYVVVTIAIGFGLRLINASLFQ